MNRAKILIVDDVPQNIQIVGNLLSSENYDVFFALSGEEALQIAQTQDLHLILMDVMMPGMNGFDTVRALKAQPQHRNTPVIFLTALSEKENILDGFDAGGVDYVTKPFNRSELLARVRTHVALSQTREELRQASLMRDRFFAILAHDLRSPFQALLGLLSETLVQFETLGSEDIKDILQGVHGSSEKAYELLQNLLEWGRSQTGHIILTPEKISLKPLVEGLEHLNAVAFQEKKIQFDSSGVKDSCWADRNTLEFILRNLVSNALKFTPEGGTVTLKSEVSGEQVLISVRDTGVGMDEEKLARLFRLDQRVSTPGTKKEPGSGLGLILCRDFAQKNRGELTVESQVGKGSVFRLTLPLNPAGNLP